MNTLLPPEGRALVSGASTAVDIANERDEAARGLSYGTPCRIALRY